MYVIGGKFSLSRQGMKCDIVTNVELVYLRLSVAPLQVCEQGGWLQTDKIDMFKYKIQIPQSTINDTVLDLATSRDGRIPRFLKPVPRKVQEG